MACRLSKEKRKEYSDVFLELDTDGNGWLSREEMGNWLKKAGCVLYEQQIESVFRLIDLNANGRISLDEFYTAMELINKPPDKTPELKKVFQAMDTDGNGMLSVDELYEGLRKCGYSVTREQVEKYVTNLARNENGQISFEDFAASF